MAVSCVTYGEYNISSNVSIPVNPNTRLSALLPSSATGYRIFYEVSLYLLMFLPSIVYEATMI